MSKRLVGLDYIRVFSVLVICAFHTSIHLHCNYGIVQDFIQNGAVLMSTFFILSGFVLTYTNRAVLKAPSKIKQFYLKRAVSILPLYYICGVLHSAMWLLYHTIIKPGGGVSYLKNIFLLIPIEFLGLQSIYTTLFPYVHNAGTWFISCLIICYLLYPFVLFLLELTSDRLKLQVVVFICFFLIYSSYIVNTFNLSRTYDNPAIRLLEFIVGVLLCLLWENITEDESGFLSNRVLIVTESVFLIVAISVIYRLFHLNDYMLYSIIVIPLSSLLIFGLAGTSCSNNKLLFFMSDISYCFFLAQLFSNTICKFLITRYGIISNLQKMIMGWVSCFAIAIVLHYCFEKPLKKILNEKLKSITVI